MNTRIIFIAALIPVLTAVSAYADWDDGGSILFYNPSEHKTRGNEPKVRDYVFTTEQGPPNIVACKVGDDIYVHAVFFAPPDDSEQHFRIYHSYAKVTGQNEIEGGPPPIEGCLTDDDLGHFRKFPSIAVDDSNNLHVVWEDSRHSSHMENNDYHWDNYEIYYNKATFSTPGGEPTWTWGTETRITNQTGYSGTPCIACDSIGNAHIVWEDNADDVGYWRGLEDVWYCMVNPVGMVMDMTVVTEHDRGFIGRRNDHSVKCRIERFGNPVVKVDGYDNVYVVWMDNHKAVEAEWEDNAQLYWQHKLYLRVRTKSGFSYHWSSIVDLSEKFGIEDWYGEYSNPNEDLVGISAWAFTVFKGNDINRPIAVVLYHEYSGLCRYYLYSTEYGTVLDQCEFANNDFEGSAYYLETDPSFGLHALCAGHQGDVDHRYIVYKYKPYNGLWGATEIVETMDAQVDPTVKQCAFFMAPTLVVDYDGHLHTLYTKRDCFLNGDPWNNNRYDYEVYYENNWDSGLSFGSPPAPPTDLTTGSDTRGKTGYVDLTWTLSINDPEYWDRFTVEPTPLSAPGTTASGISTPSEVSGSGVTIEGSAAPISAAEGDKLKDSIVSTGPTSVDSPDASGSIVRPDELDVEEYWVIVHYYPGGTEGRTEEYLAGGPGTDKFTVPNIPAGALADYSFSVYCKDAVYDSEVTGPCAAVATAINAEDDGAATMFTSGTIPTVYALYQSVPNPNDGSCSIRYDLPESCRAKMTVYDLTGRRVKTVFDTDMAAGAYACSVSDLEAGVYVYRLEAGDFVASRKMVVIK